MKSWKTTTMGILNIVGAIATAGVLALKGQYDAAIAALSTGIPSGIGLIAARDNDKSSESVNAK